jgi:2-dehydropantoate 2-reductase
MRIIVYGTGAVGGYFGARLAQAGREVVFIARGKRLEAMRRNGLRVDSILGDFVLRQPDVTEDPAGAGIADLVLLGVKSWQVPEAALAMRPMIGPDSAVLPLQNGVEAPDQIAAVLGKKAVLGGLARISSESVSPDHIRHPGVEPTIVFGELDDSRTERVEKIRSALEVHGIKAQIAPDIHAAMWDKFLFITAVSGLGAVVRAPMGVLRSVPETRQLLIRAMEEVLAVGRSRGIRMRDDIVERTLKGIDTLPPGVTSSMQRDIAAGLPSELEEQNGSVARMGSETGIPTPVQSFLYACLLPSEMKARGKMASA